MKQAATGYRGRFAPSPTGPLHFGSLIAALASYCDARAHGGEWLVRIEDLDEPRSSRAAAATILAQLVTYGFRIDGPIAWQNERNALYQSALDDLVARGLAFAAPARARTSRAQGSAPAASASIQGLVATASRPATGRGRGESR